MNEIAPGRSQEYGPLTPGELIPELEAPDAQLLGELIHFASLDKTGKLLSWALDLAYTSPLRVREELHAHVDTPRSSFVIALRVAQDVQVSHVETRIGLNPRQVSRPQPNNQTRAAITASPYFRNYHERRDALQRDPTNHRKTLLMYSAFFAGLAFYAADTTESGRMLPSQDIE